MKNSKINFIEEMIMIRSMTGFGSATFDNGMYKIGIEMKAVNKSLFNSRL